MVLTINTWQVSGSSFSPACAADDVGHDGVGVSPRGHSSFLRADVGIAIQAIADLQDATIHHNPKILNVAVPPTLLSFGGFLEN